MYIVERYECCCSTGSTRVTMSDAELTALTMKLIIREEQSWRIGIVRDEYLRNAKFFPFEQDQATIVWTSRQSLLPYRDHIHKASYSKGHLNVFYSAKDMPAIWEALTERGAILCETGTRLQHEALSEMLGPGPKARLIDEIHKRLDGENWLSFSHDAEYVLRTVDSS